MASTIGYVDKLNGLLRGPGFADKSLEVIVEEYAKHSATNKEAAPIFNIAAQAWNHAFYWQSLRPPGGRAPVGVLAAQIAATFGGPSVCAQALMSAATGHFGSGWAWLVADRGALETVTTANADTPIVRGLTPLLVIDVWEHAYYLDRHERRASNLAVVIATCSTGSLQTRPAGARRAQLRVPTGLRHRCALEFSTRTGADHVSAKQRGHLSRARIVAAPGLVRQRCLPPRLPALNARPAEVLGRAG